MATMTEIEKRFSMQQQLMGLVICLVICFSAAGVGGLATAGSVNSDWFSELIKPEWNPPDWVFGPVWSILYLMMAISAWLVWRCPGSETAKWALSWFGFHLILNVMWSVLFFGLQRPGWAAIEIVLLWISILISIGLFYRDSKLAAGLLIPYLLWVSFATYLNITIWSLN